MHIRTGGLATILLRAGLKIDRQAFKQTGWRVFRLACVPLVMEVCTLLHVWCGYEYVQERQFIAVCGPSSQAIVDAVMFLTVYGMPALLAFTGGFITAAISPTVLVTGMLELQRQGYGEAKSGQ